MTTFQTTVIADPTLPPALTQQVSQAAETSANFVSAKQVRASCEQARLPAAQTDAIVAHYAQAQISALKTAFAGIALFALLALAYVRRLPSGKARDDESESESA